MSARVLVLGAGVAGLAAALELSLAGAEVEVVERGSAPGAQAASWFAGGMLAPWCEKVSGEPAVVALGWQALDWWRGHHAQTRSAGTLVVAASRDRAELDHYANRTGGYQRLDDSGIGELEPDLAGRFQYGLFFAEEAHVNPRAALGSLASRLGERGVPIHYATDADHVATSSRSILDCRGYGARAALPELRGVRGEMLLLQTRDIALSRPVRLLHPRGMTYVVPHGDGLFMVGGTMIESADAGPITARSLMELLNGAYALHPAFAEARIVESGVGIRPAFPDNLPKLLQRGGRWHLNGLYRHGFLLAPAMARQAAAALLGKGVSTCSSW